MQMKMVIIASSGTGLFGAMMAPTALSLMGANAQNARTAQGGARRVEEDLSAESLFITTYRMKIRQP